MASGVQELHFPHLRIPVTVNQKIPVEPAGPIPVNPGHSLYLSNLDDIIGARVFTPTVYFYRSYDPNHFDREYVIQRLRDALAEVLVPYYPLSGRLRDTQNGKLEVFFGPDQGALMVTANASMELTELGDLTVPNPAWLPLIYSFEDEEPYKVLEMPLLIAQVTFFSCGGFSLGLRLCHCICDGFGAMQFLDSWAATAKTGRLVTDPEPVWDREFLKPRNPPKVRYPHFEYTQIDEKSSLTKSLWETKPVQRCYQVSKEFQARIKTLAQNADDQFVFSSFDAMAAHVWRSWVTALDVKPLDYDLRLTFSVNTRPKLKNPRLKRGFYGNAVCLACAMSPSRHLIGGSLAKTTRLVHKARLSVSEEYLRSTVDYVEVNRPQRLEFGGKLMMTQWTRFEMYGTADFGWGCPVYAGPIDLRPTPQVCILLPEGGGTAEGAMVVCICLPEKATDEFIRILSLADSE